MVSGEAKVLIGEAETYATLSRYPEALAKATAGLAAARAVEDAADETDALRIEAGCLLGLERPEEALQAVHTASAIAAGNGADLNRFLDLLQEAGVLRRSGRSAAAAEKAYQALEASAAFRPRLADPLLWDGDVRRVYDVLIPALIDLGRDDEALQRADEARARILREQLAGAAGGAPEGLPGSTSAALPGGAPGGLPSGAPPPPPSPRGPAGDATAAHR